MSENSNKSGLKVGFGVIMLIIGTVLMGTIGGAIVGGLVGYTVAINVQPEPMVVTSSTAPVSEIHSDMSSVMKVDASAPATAGLSENEALVKSVEEVNPATVTVINQSARGITSGSGVIIDDTGYLVTNHHVVNGADRLVIILSQGGRVPAQLVGSSADFDLAVLKIDADYVPAVARFGDSAALRLGERVAAIGSALGGFRNTVTSGVISAHNRSLGGQRGLLQTDTPINHGNSGGPLINLYGEVVGINVMVLRGSSFSGDIAEGLGFAIPSNTVKTVVKQLIETGRAEMPFLGISYSELNPQLSMEKGISITNGALIEAVLKGTAADNAGLKVNDIVYAINGQQIDDMHPLAQQLLEYSVGEVVTLTVIREDQQIEMTVTLGKRPSGN